LHLVGRNEKIKSYNLFSTKIYAQQKSRGISYGLWIIFGLFIHKQFISPLSFPHFASMNVFSSVNGGPDKGFCYQMYADESV